MGLNLTLTDLELPASPVFIEFLYNALNGKDHHDGEWYAQEEESLIVSADRFEDIQEKAKIVLASKIGNALVTRSYRFFKEMLTGRPETLKNIMKFHFIFVVGIPRTGGTYLSKQLFRACDIDYKKVQNALAHDGFPHIAHLAFKNKGNVHTNSLLQLAEYLVMAEMYFTMNSKLKYKGGVVIPKKFTKAIYNFPLVKEMFGANSTSIITLRHPLSMTQSVLDKSGGMPKGRKFEIRSAIERWAFEDWLAMGYSEEEIYKKDYVEVFLGYWQRYHYNMALSGMPAMSNSEIVLFGKDSMTKYTKKLFEKLEVDLEPEEFKDSSDPEFSDKNMKKADKIISEVGDFWRSLGLTFPDKKL